MIDTNNIKNILLNAGVQISHHASDLYCEKTETSEAIIKEYKYFRNVTTFTSIIDNKVWYEIPFAY